MRIEDHTGLVHHIIKKKKTKIIALLNLKKHYDMEDVYQLGMIGLWKAIQNYDETKSKFGHYAGLRIEGEIFNSLRIRYKNQKKLYSNTDYITKGIDDDGEDLNEAIPLYEDSTSKWVNDFLNTLTEEQKELVIARMYGYTFKELYQVYKYHQGTVYRKLDKVGIKYKGYEGEAI